MLFSIISIRSSKARDNSNLKRAVSMDIRIAEEGSVPCCIFLRKFLFAALPSSSIFRNPSMSGVSVGFLMFFKIDVYFFSSDASFIQVLHSSFLYPSGVLVLS